MTSGLDKKTIQILNYQIQLEERRVWRSESVNRRRTCKQHNGKKKEDKRTNNDVQNTTHTTKDLVTLSSLKYVCEFMSSGSVGSSCSNSGTGLVNLAKNITTGRCEHF
jgi:hypothetical protein